ncbi:MAG: peroxidase, partial [Phycisphaerae bacterium]|nr:peroxidase [Phycisphaerae bacterium]
MNRRAFLSAVAASVAGGSVLGAGVRGVAPGLPSGATPPKTAPIPPARPEGAPARTLRKAAMLGMVADDAAT